MPEAKPALDALPRYLPTWTNPVVIVGTAAPPRLPSAPLERGGASRPPTGPVWRPMVGTVRPSPRGEILIAEHAAARPAGLGAPGSRRQALALQRPELDPGRLPPTGDNTVKSIALADGVERRRQVGEQVPVLHRGSSCTQVVDECGAGILDQRQDQRLPRLVLDDLDRGRGPVQVVELETLDVALARPRRAASSKMA